MATKAEMIRILKRVKKLCKPEIATKANYMLIRDTCILHKYLEITMENGIFINPYGCLGGGICRDLQEILGVTHSNMCPKVHNNIYNFIKNDRETVKI
jgi:hypothetical protein